MVMQWAAFGAITGAGAGALIASGPFGASVAKVYVGSVASGTAWTLGFNALFSGNERAIQQMGGVPAPDRISKMVADTARDAGLLSTPKAWLIPSSEPNAFAMDSGLLAKHKPHAVAVTKGLVSTLTNSELHAVIAHEIGHIRHHDCGRAIQTASMVSGLRTAMRLGWQLLKSESQSKRSKSNGSDKDDDSGSGAAGILLIGVGGASYVASNLLRLSSSRAAEFAADAAAAELVPNGDVHLASALQKIERSTVERDELGGSNDYLSHMYFSNRPSELRREPGFWTKAADLFSTHPRTADRVAELLPVEAASTGAEPAGSFVAFGRELAFVVEDGLW